MNLAHKNIPMWLQAVVLIITTSGSAYIGQKSAVTASAAQSAPPRDPEITVAIAAINSLKESVDRLSIQLAETSTRLADIDKKVAILDDREQNRASRLR